MKPKNKYINRTKVSERKTREILKLFSADLTATQIANLSSVNRNTINRFLTGIRHRICESCQKEFSLEGQIEVDESWFGAKRKKGKRGRGAYGKTIVFGLFKRNGKVYTEIVPDCSKDTLQAIIRGKVSLESIIHSDGWRGYNGLVDLGYKKHFRVQHSADEFVNGQSHINGIEGFWGLAKSRLVRFKGMHKSTFLLHLKECEFRFNHRHESIYKLLLEMLRDNPLF